MGQLKIDAAEIARVLHELVAIPSVNPAFDGGCGEAGVAEYVKHYLEEQGISCIEQPVEPGRSNIIGMLPGAVPGPVLLLEAHMDTVQITGMTIDPYAGSVIDGKLYGRGACDTKGSLAAMLVAMGTLGRSGLALPVGVHLAAVVDEEYRYKGVSRLAEAISSGGLGYLGAIVGEPTGLHRVIAHKGCVRFYIDVHGRPGHSSEPDKGVNAIEQMAEVIRCLKEEIAPSYLRQHHPLLGAPTHCISEITGGAAPNTIPGSCRITIDRRTVPGEEPLEVWQGFRERLRELERMTPGLRLTVQEPFIIDYAMETSAGHPLVRQLAAAVGGYAAGRGEHGAAYGTDASKLARVSVPSVVFGPGGIGQAHTANEWVLLHEVESAASALADLVLHYRRDGL
ncbi:M20 family metallopeptidase [Paenibacillus sp. S150]|uniref:M20 family metallopeptidase n=1 Tax=Paenibacillus sp. S150 TaxID=2749826 RepID=UPI001C55C0D4|nr:M20 family metallopeptidase [Paenibacillus sp. S150]MBW4085769.1 M20 family metallopeptidase [Paenibacillus sp. S150]